MASVVTLKIKDQEGNVKNINHEVEEMNVLQFKQVMGKVKDISKQVSDDAELKSLFGTLMKAQPQEDEEQELQVDQDIISKAVASFDTLAVHLPEHAFHLLSIVSGISQDYINQQKLKAMMDIYDAVLEENDIEDLIARAKKSLALTAVKFKLKNLMEKGKEAVTQ